MNAGHAFRRPVLRVVDEHGNVPCAQCGRAEGAHRRSVKDALTFLLEQEATQLETDLAGVRHKIDLVRNLPEEEVEHGPHE